jgi:hypothetical protein
MTSLERWDEIQTNLERGMDKASVIVACLIIKVNDKLMEENLPEELIQLYIKHKEGLLDLVNSFDTYRQGFQVIRNKLISKGNFV